jgi:uncharacterized YccA/Bax inhibitor family protein
MAVDRGDGATREDLVRSRRDFDDHVRAAAALRSQRDHVGSRDLEKSLENALLVVVGGDLMDLDRPPGPLRLHSHDNPSRSGMASRLPLTGGSIFSSPVFARNDGFNGRGGAVATSPSEWKVDLDGGQSTSPTHTERGQGRMTLDTVVEKTAISLGLVIAAAAAAWFFIGDLAATDPTEAQAAQGLAFSLAIGGALIGLVLSLVNSFKKIVSPGLVIAYAVVEGVFVGAFSKVIASYVGDPTIVFQAVLATMVAFGGTLAAYKFFNIQVTDKFRKVVTIAIFSFVGVMLINFVLSLTGVLESGGLRGFNTLGLLVSAAAVVLAVLMLILDFDFVEQGVAAGLPERESWRAAFGLTVTLVWLYIELLRILAILRGSD